MVCGKGRGLATKKSWVPHLPAPITGQNFTLEKDKYEITIAKLVQPKSGAMVKWLRQTDGS